MGRFIITLPWLDFPIPPFDDDVLFIRGSEVLNINRIAGVKK